MRTQPTTAATPGPATTGAPSTPATPTAPTSHIVVVGLGYIGLPTAVVLAQSGFQVTGVDISPDTVATINRAELPFHEPLLAEALQEVIAAGTLRATTEIPSADAFIIAVPTPHTDSNEPDLSAVRAAVRAIAPKLQPGNIVNVESTIPPGTTQEVASILLELRPDLSLDGSSESGVYVTHVPERVLPGKIMTELRTNHRIIGGLNEGAAERARDIYANFVTGEIHLTDATTAEMTKLAENSFRDVNIAFANELSLIAHSHGVNVWDLITLANYHPRVNILSPGAGVGGHCIAVDPWFLVHSDPANSPLIRTARTVNDAKPLWVVDQALALAQAHPEVTSVAVLGMTFKPDVDDTREAPALTIIETLLAKDAFTTIQVIDPHVAELPEALVASGRVTLVQAADLDPESTIMIAAVSHSAFLDLDESFYNSPLLVDACGLRFQRTSLR